MALTCQAAVTRHTEEPALEPSGGQAGRPREQADTHDWGQVSCTLAQLPIFVTQEQMPQDPERGTHSPTETSGKFG